MVRIDPKERTNLLDVRANLSKISDQMPEDFIPLTIKFTNVDSKAIDLKLFKNNFIRNYDKRSQRLTNLWITSSKTDDVSIFHLISGGSVVHGSMSPADSK